jgi:hypothetical protein
MYPQVHSYLVLRYAEGDKVSQSVGFYYMANAAGRLSGTLVSGAIFSYTDPAFATRGMGFCYLAGAACSVIATLLTYLIKDDVAGLQCGSCVCIEASEGDEVVGVVAGTGTETNSIT